MKSLANGKVIAGIVALVAALFLSALSTSESFRRKIDSAVYKVSTMFSGTEKQAGGVATRLDKLQGKRSRGDVKTLADEHENRDTVAEIRLAAQGFIDDRSKSGMFPIYDEIGDELLELSFERQHDEVGEETGVFVSCFAFHDSGGRVVDVDVLVIRDGGRFRATTSRLHSVNGETRLPRESITD